MIEIENQLLQERRDDGEMPPRILKLPMNSVSIEDGRKVEEEGGFNMLLDLDEARGWTSSIQGNIFSNMKEWTITLIDLDDEDSDYFEVPFEYYYDERRSFWNRKD